ncbi:MAG: hypothetical protein EON59_16680 [Alphaproteobacteria bacterium]|nr:MAG: hypothetical protein EON59_16680 [Alphaproteobacteria bacterium]
MGTLDWVASSGGAEGELALSGKICVGFVVQAGRSEKSNYEIEAVWLADLTDDRGEAPSKAAAKEAVEHAWSPWCEAAGLRACELWRPPTRAPFIL